MSRILPKPNKTEQIARFLLGKGAMNSRQIYEAGFRFKHGAETTVCGINVLLNKMHHSSRYVVERFTRGVDGNQTTSVKVLSIVGAGNAGTKESMMELNRTQRELWRMVLTRKPGSVARMAAGGGL